MDIMTFSSFYLFLFLFIIVLGLLLLPINVCIISANSRENISIEIILYFLDRKFFRGKKILNTVQRKEYSIPGLLWEAISRGELDNLWPKKGKTFSGASISIFSGLLKFIFNNTTWYKMDVFLQLGTSNPAHTALLSAVLQAGMETFSSYLLKKIVFVHNKPRFWIYPYFLESRFRFYTRLSFKGKAIIVTVLSLLAAATFIIVKILERWMENERSSYSGINGNSYGKSKRDG